MDSDKRKGRPREFDMDDALDAMLNVFWDKGYEGTSLTDILDATGLQKGSLYKAFQNKQEMYLRALEHYVAQTLADKKAVIDSAVSPLAGIEAMLKKVVADSCTKGNDHRGCLAVRSMMDRTSHDEGVVAILKGSVGAAEIGLERLVTAGQVNGEIRDDLSAKMLAEALYCLMAGMLATSRITTSRARTNRLVAFGVEMLKAHGR